MPFVHGSSCQLTRLFLEDIYIWLPSPMSQMEEIIDILEQLPTLEDFGLLCSDRGVPDVWGALTVPSNRAALCPALSSVIYGWRGPHNLDYYGVEIIDSFFAMLQSRIGLNSVRVLALRTAPEFEEAVNRKLALLPATLDAAILGTEAATDFLMHLRP
ncbi:hypothetical protein FB45DRAFT_1094389 [Roridomyces roridus]|uniref:Uncharacterized protein n=1 Tax=Roridomyces roridus TaxID=1738132 RepID=A0AAD7FIA0_9AGAR|nr:hypothetical protein FB45DRAFT_1094389 [Roridomyces roridus]